MKTRGYVAVCAPFSRNGRGHGTFPGFCFAEVRGGLATYWDSENDRSAQIKLGTELILYIRTIVSLRVDFG